MPHSVKDIQNRIIELLDPLKDSGNLGVRTIDSYEGQLETDEFLKGMSHPTPAIYVAYTGCRLSDYEARQIEELTFMIFVVDKCFINRGKIAGGSSKNPGTLAMLAGIREKIQNKIILSGLYQMVLENEDIVGYLDGYGIYAAVYKVKQPLLVQIQQL